MLFRDCCQGDLIQVSAIYAHYVRHSTATFELEPPDAAEIGRRFASLTDAGLPCLVAEENGEIAGYAYASPYRPRAAYRYTVEDSIYLDPARVGQRIGAALLERLLAGCEAWGARQMVAVIGGSDNTASIRLHERFGFRHVGVLQAAGYKFGRWVDTVLMQRALGAGDSIHP